MFGDGARVHQYLSRVEAKTRKSEARVQHGKLCQIKQFLIDLPSRSIVPFDDKIFVELLKMLNDTAGKHCVGIHKQESAPWQLSHHLEFAEPPAEAFSASGVNLSVPIFFDFASAKITIMSVFEQPNGNVRIPVTNAGYADAC